MIHMYDECTGFFCVQTLCVHMLIGVLCVVDLEISAPPPPPPDCFDGFDDIPPLPPPVDYDTAVPANYLERGKATCHLLCHSCGAWTRLSKASVWMCEFISVCVFVDMCVDTTNTINSDASPFVLLIDIR